MAPGTPHADNRWGYVNMGYGMRKFPRYEDAVTFDDADLDYRGFPNMTITYALTDAENAEIAAGTEHLRRAGNALGTFVAEPRLLPNGSSLHYQGTLRMGPSTTARRSPTRGRGCGDSATSTSEETG